MSVCEKDICHNMCDLQAICQSPWCCGPRPGLLQPQSQHSHTSAALGMNECYSLLTVYKYGQRLTTTSL